mmetsp:Transcript_7738/g.14027  ORF Transcript_7738/g.14027 Transcript_7738/m.14027 type:complete len:98 (-) Transcript_7738:91-384(-)
MGLCQTLCCCTRRNREQYRTTDDSCSERSDSLSEQVGGNKSLGSESKGGAAYNPGLIHAKVTKTKEKLSDSDEDLDISRRSSMSSSVGVSTLFMPLL